MKFELKYVMEVDDFELLDIVNDFQDDNELEWFDTFEEIPFELAIMAMSWCDYIEEEIEGIYWDDFMITKIDEEN